ncbi:hypothetical protein EPN52_09790 [bacterium]|nr:MAG: hypothetical protein EPN52_09790 [bacterium]
MSERLRLAPVPATLILLLAGCTTGQSNTTPAITFTPSNGTLKLAVGTVNFAGGGSGLNVLETFRGSNGFTAVPINQALLGGPAGFMGPGGSRDPGAGSNPVPLGSAANVFAIGSAGQITILAAADGFGIGPPLASTTGQNAYPMQPQFGDMLGKAAFPFQPLPLYGGPPAYPAATLVANAFGGGPKVPSGWSEGFYLIALAAAAPTGTYTLSVAYSQNGAAATANATAALASSALLPPLAPPGLASSGNGGLTVTVTLPPGVVEELINVTDATTPGLGATCAAGVTFATVRATSSGAYGIAGNLGPNGTPTFCPGDQLVAQSFGFDYLDQELGPPGNTLPAPSLPAQADVTVSPPAVTME